MDWLINCEVYFGSNSHEVIFLFFGMADISEINKWFLNFRFILLRDRKIKACQFRRHLLEVFRNEQN